MSEQSPVVFPVTYGRDGLAVLNNIQDEKKRTLLLDYPTVYVIGTEDKRHAVMLYVGETTDIRQRTIQHMDIDPSNHEEWQQIAQGKDGRMVVIGHPHFNKSMTLDIENQLMLYPGLFTSVFGT